MKHRTQALVLCAGLLLVFGGWAGTRPGAFTLFMPGPTLNILGKTGGKPILRVVGHKSFRDQGQLRLVTISSTRAGDKVGLVRALQGWFDPDVDVYPYLGIYRPTDTSNSTELQSAQQMTSSKDAAIAAALTELGIRFRKYVEVAAVSKDGASAGLLKVGDRVVSVNGATASRLSDVIDNVRRLRPGSPVKVEVLRSGQTVVHTLITKPAGTSGPEARQSLIGVSIKSEFDFPFEVKVNISEGIGGPSAGMMFALSIIDVLTPGSLTGGKAIAGTGEIDENGQVGPIGGIKQKIVGAQDDGARLFLVPADNCAEALQAHYDKDRIRLVRVATLEDAMTSIKTWVQNPEARLSACRAAS